MLDSIEWANLCRQTIGRTSVGPSTTKESGNKAPSPPAHTRYVGRGLGRLGPDLGAVRSGLVLATSGGAGHRLPNMATGEALLLLLLAGCLIWQLAVVVV